MQYTGETSTETASIVTAKLLINSTLLKKGAKFIAMDISNFFVHNELKYYQYMRFALNEIPEEIIDEYNLKIIVHKDGYCYVEIKKALYDLQEAGYVANVELKRILRSEGYVPSKITPGLYIQKTRDIELSLVVDDFGVRYTKRKDTEHLLKAIQGRYPVKAEWDPTFYLGMTLDFDYEE